MTSEDHRTSLTVSSPIPRWWWGIEARMVLSLLNWTGADTCNGYSPSFSFASFTITPAFKRTTTATAPPAKNHPPGKEPRRLGSPHLIDQSQLTWPIRSGADSALELPTGPFKKHRRALPFRPWYVRFPPIHSPYSEFPYAVPVHSIYTPLAGDL